MAIFRSSQTVWPACLAAGSLLFSSCGLVVTEVASVNESHYDATAEPIAEPLLLRIHSDQLTPITQVGFQFGAPPLPSANVGSPQGKLPSSAISAPGIDPPSIHPFQRQEVAMPGVPSEEGPALLPPVENTNGRGSPSGPAASLPTAANNPGYGAAEMSGTGFYPEIFRLPPVVVDDIDIPMRREQQGTLPVLEYVDPNSNTHAREPIAPGDEPTRGLDGKNSPSQRNVPQPIDSPQIPPTAKSSPAMAMYDAAQLKAISDQAESIVRNGWSLAERGASFTARAEFLRALQRIAQAHDAQTSTTRHSDALASGLQALKEADDFLRANAIQGGSEQVRELATVHRTPVLRLTGNTEIAPLRALQLYYDYAQQQLAIAGANEPVASWALFALGRLFCVAQNGSPAAENGAAKAIVSYQAALMVDARNHMAANELGVHLARQGQWGEARRSLEHSIAQSRRPESLHNLAVVLGRMGNAEAAATLAREAEQSVRTARAEPDGERIRWMETAAFARTAGPNETTLPATTAPVAGGPGARMPPRPAAANRPTKSR